MSTGTRLSPEDMKKLEAKHPQGLLDALLSVQSEAPSLTLDAENPHFKSKFVSLAKMVETVKPLLAKNGLVWTTMPCRDQHGDPALRYRLAHTSGEAMEDTMPLLLTKADPQGQGSAITYARRYALAAVLNLVADEDDDGNGASGNAKGGNEATPPQKRAITTALRKFGAEDDLIKAIVAKANASTKKGASTLLDLLNTDGATLDTVCASLGVVIPSADPAPATADLPDVPDEPFAVGDDDPAVDF